MGGLFLTTRILVEDDKEDSETLIEQIPFAWK